jgi:hypothetical protein
VDTGFRTRSCSNNKLERDDDSKISHPALVLDQRKYRPEGDAGQLQRGTLEVDHVATDGAFEGDPVGAEQWLEIGVVVVPQRRDLRAETFSPSLL